MTRSELIYKLSKAFPALSIKQLTKLVNVLFDKMTDTLCEGGRIELRGFGAFTVRKRESRQARNPKTGEKVSVGDKYAPYFRAGKELRERVNKAS